MSILTENIVLSRAKAPDLNSVKKLNCWGSNLSDVSIVRKMTFVEVLSLSVNNISTLADFSYCLNLQELYLRKNNILDLNEVRFLKCLPHLQSLWLADNPCAERSNYRLTVLRALPNLKCLDNILVTSDEVVCAATSGDDLEGLCNSSNVLYEDNTVSLLSHFQPTEVSTVMPHISKQNNYGIADEQADLHCTSIQSLLPGKKMVLENVNHCNFSSSICSASPISDKCVKENKQLHLTSGGTNSSCNHAFRARVQTMVDHPEYTSNDYINETICSDLFGDPHMEIKISENSTSQVNDPDDAASTGDGYLQILKRNDCKYNNKDEFQEHFLKSGQLHAFDQNFNHNIRKMNSNILSAVLCLVKELDFSSLEVVKAAVHCRMDEMND